MRLVVDLHQPRRIYRGIGLGGRERGMAEQFLDRAQIAAGGEQVGGEAVAQRMRGGVGGQAELEPGALHHLGHQPRVERPAALAAKEGIAGAVEKGQSAT